MSWLAYAHPIAMSVLLGLAVFVLREGLRIRRGRLLGARVDPRRHRQLARWVVGLLALGFAGGLASMYWLRTEPIGESVHFSLAAPGLLGMLAAGALGLRLERRPRSGVRGPHAALGALGLLLALAAAVAGFAILP